MSLSEGEYQEQAGIVENAGDDVAWDDDAYDPQFHLFDEPPAPRTITAEFGVWIPNGGAPMKIADMTTEHLRNAISWAERHDYGTQPKIDELRAELAKR